MSLRTLDKSEGIAIFTDGSAWTGDKSGGWAWIAIDAFDGEAQDSGAMRGTTNNRMEMLAWIKGLEAIFHELGPCQVLVYSDSEYVGLGATDRLRKRNCNHDLWGQLDVAVDRHPYVEFCYVRGHSNDFYNEKVDKLAGEARQREKDNAEFDHDSHSTSRRAPKQCSASGRRNGKQPAARSNARGRTKRRSKRSK